MQGAHAIELGLISVPTNRFRPVKEKVEDIAQSLASFGQLQPIILRPDGEGKYVLVDGLHRFTAAGMNGQLTIDAVLTEEMDPLTLRKIELEVNIQRVDMTWKEKVSAIAALHKLEEETSPGATQASTAAKAGVHQRDVHTAIKLSKMMELFPEIGEAKSINQALSWAESKAGKTLRVHDVRERKADFAGIEEKIIHGDSVEVIKLLPDEQFNLILTDPPFGINYDERKAGTSGAVSAYKDDADSYNRILTMAEDLHRVITPDGWLVWFLGPSWYETAKIKFQEVGFIVDEIPLIWDRSEGKAWTSRPDRYFARAYDMALHCIKGNPQVIQRGKPNIIRVPPVGQTEREMLVERPVELYAEIIRRLTVPGETVADFFVGSGSCPAAAASLGRDFFGVELSPERRAYALNKIKAHIPDARSKAAGVAEEAAKTG
jgi:ParB/RepB/Spo0J family partition protein